MKIKIGVSCFLSVNWCHLMSWCDWCQAAETGHIESQRVSSSSLDSNEVSNDFWFLFSWVWVWSLFLRSFLGSTVAAFRFSSLRHDICVSTCSFLIIVAQQPGFSTERCSCRDVSSSLLLMRMSHQSVIVSSETTKRKWLTGSARMFRNKPARRQFSRGDWGQDVELCEEIVMLELKPNGKRNFYPQTAAFFTRLALILVSIWAESGPWKFSFSAVVQLSIHPAAASPSPSPSFIAGTRRLLTKSQLPDAFWLFLTSGGGGRKKRANLWHYSVLWQGERKCQVWECKYST